MSKDCAFVLRERGRWTANCGYVCEAVADGIVGVMVEIANGVVGFCEAVEGIV